MVLTLRRRDKVILSVLVALFVALTLGEEGPRTILNWWCVLFPGQSPVAAEAAGEPVYSLRLLELLGSVLGA